MRDKLALADIRFHPDVEAKGKAYLLARRVHRGDPGIFSVQGVVDEPYLVRTDASSYDQTVSFCACTCSGTTDYGRGWSRCAHSVAVLLLVRDGPKPWT